MPNVIVESYFVSSVDYLNNVELKDANQLQHLLQQLPQHLELLIFKASKTIYPGQEVFINYGQAYWDYKQVYDKKLPQIEIQRSFDQLYFEYFDLKSKYTNLMHNYHDAMDRLEYIESYLFP